MLSPLSSLLGFANRVGQLSERLVELELGVKSPYRSGLGVVAHSDTKLELASVLARVPYTNQVLIDGVSFTLAHGQSLVISGPRFFSCGLPHTRGCVLLHLWLSEYHLLAYSCLQ